MLQTTNSQREALLWYLCAAVIVSGLWTASDVAGFLLPPLLIGWALVLLVLPSKAMSEAEERSTEPLGKPAWTQLLIGCVVAAPLVVWLVSFRPEEFPFIGDHNVHLRHLVSAVESWRMAWLPAVACLLLMLPGIRRALPAWSPVAIVGVWMLAGIAIDPANGFAVRYPGSLHFIAVPIAIVREALHLQPPLDSLRYANALALPAWLFVFRPLVVRRWPDLGVLPFALFVFFQKDVIYYTSSAYLEPWSFVALALAVELLVRGDRRDGWKAVLAAFAAPLVKEYTILVAPWVAVSAYLRAEGKDERRQVLLSAGTGMLLFGFYYAARSRAGVLGAGGFDPAGIAPARLGGYVAHAVQQFGWATPIAVSLVCALVWFASRRGMMWRTFAPLFAALVIHNLYFLGGRGTQEWLGYPRFQVPLLALIAAPLLMIPDRPTTKATLLAVSLVIAGTNLLAARPLFAVARQPEYAMNFFEHRDAPVFLPFQHVVEEAEGRGWTKGVRRLRVLSNLHGVKRGYLPMSLPAAYPEIAKRFAIDVEPVDFSMLDRCSCDSADEAVIGLYVYFNGAESPDAPVDGVKNAAAQCHARIVRSCASSFGLRYKGQLIGSYGRGVAARGAK